ncbi:MAG: hypothetical protein WKG52_18675 [Variovorax sp.]
MLLTICLLGSLPLQTISSVIAGVLGPRHLHQTAELEKTPADPMAGWKDFRRAKYDTPGATASVGHSHAHLHELALRHHHEHGDGSFVNLEASVDGDGAPADLAQASASFVFVAARGTAPLPQPLEAFGAVWRPLTAQPMSSQHPRRIERPPQTSV